MGGSDGLTETNVLVGLIRVADFDYPEPPSSTFAQNTSAYKACKVSKGTYLPFDDSAFVLMFDERVRHNHGQAVDVMTGFLNDYTDVENGIKIDRLVRALLELIDTDCNILNDTSFYINRDGSYVTKSALHSLVDVQLQPFLLGVWHYIVTEVQDNAIGQATYVAWHKEPEQKGQQWEFISKIGDGITHDIAVSFESGFCQGVDDTANTAEREPCFGYEDSRKGQASFGMTKQTVNNPVVFNQYGNNNVQIGSIDTLTINNN
jgi:hypothetical protein